jgi:hypothetical protein
MEAIEILILSFALGCIVTHAWHRDRGQLRPGKWWRLYDWRAEDDQSSSGSSL